MDHIYMMYFQEPGIAEREFERDVARTLACVYYSASGRPQLVPQPAAQLGADGALCRRADPPAVAVHRRIARRVIRMPGMRIGFEEMRPMLPGLTRSVIIDGVGHWVQQEAPDQVNALLLDFLRQL